MRMFLVLLFATFLPQSLFAGGAEHAGNGGGAWVCRNQDAEQTVRWLELVDLFEAKAEFYLELREDTGNSLEEQLNQARESIQQANPSFYGELKPYLAAVVDTWPTKGAGELEVIDDSLYIRRPDRKLCAGGILAYEQVVNYTDDFEIQVNQDLYELLDSRAKAALRLHEAVYALLRDKESATDSRKARKIVAFVFSTLNPTRYSDLLSFEAPIQEEDGLDLLVLKTVYHSSSETYCSLLFESKDKAAKRLYGHVTGAGLPCRDEGKPIQFQCHDFVCEYVGAGAPYPELRIDASGSRFVSTVCFRDSGCTNNSYSVR